MRRDFGLPEPESRIGRVCADFLLAACSAPVAVPRIGATALVTVPRTRSISSIPAPTAPSADPVDRPCMTRAVNNSVTSLAVVNTTIATIWTAIAATSTGRRPTWSESEPTTSSARSTATAYTPKTTVVVIGENPQRA